MTAVVDKEIVGRAQEAHGQNVVFYSAVAAVAYAWFGAHDIGWWWPAVWFIVGIGIVLGTGILMIPFLNEAGRTPKRGWILALGLPLTLTRPFWILGLSWLVFDQIAVRWFS